MLRNLAPRRRERELSPHAEPRCCPPSASLRKADLALYAALFLAQFAGFSFLAFHRLIDSDEGFYLYISKLVFTQGTVPYRDVFYQQMPLLPYLYGGWMKVFGFSWEAGRAFSALFAALIGTFLFWHIHRAPGRSRLALCALLLYALNISALLFFLTAKTYVLSTALLFGSLLVGGDVQGRRARLSAGISGLLLALSVQTRLFFVAVAPAFALWFWSRRDPRTNRKTFGYFVGGFSLGLVPSMVLMGVAPRQFVYDNILYHGMRDRAGLIADFEQKLHVATKLIISPDSFHPTQFSFLLCGVPLAIIFWNKIGGVPRLAAAICVMLGLASFLPTPTFGQYFCVLVPFLIITLVEAFGCAVESVRSPGARRLLLTGFVLLSLVYAGAAAPRLGSLFLRAEGVPGIDPATDPADWELPTVEKIAALIESNTARESLVVSTWPGYLLTIDRKIYPKMENQIAIDTAWKLSPEEADEFRMMREDELARAIADPRVQTVVAGNCTHSRRPLYRRATSGNNYGLVSRIGNSDIYVRQSVTDLAPSDD